MRTGKSQNSPLRSNPKKEIADRAIMVIITVHQTGSVKVGKMCAKITPDLLKVGLIIRSRIGQILQMMGVRPHSRTAHLTLPKGTGAENFGHLGIQAQDLATDHASKVAGFVERGVAILQITIPHHSDHHPVQIGIMDGRQEIVPKLHHLANSGTEMTAIGLIAVVHRHLLPIRTGTEIPSSLMHSPAQEQAPAGFAEILAAEAGITRTRTELTHLTSHPSPKWETEEGHWKRAARVQLSQPDQDQISEQ